MSDKKNKSIVDIFIETFVEYVSKDIQAILDALPDDPESDDDDE